MHNCNFNFQIKDFEICGNTDIVPAGWKTIGSIAHKCHIEKLHLRDCKLATDEVKSFQEGLADSKVNYCNSNHNNCYLFLIGSFFIWSHELINLYFISRFIPLM